MFCEDFLCWLSGFVLLLPTNQEEINERHRQIILAHAELCVSVEEGCVTPFILRLQQGISEMSSDEICDKCTEAFVAKGNMDGRELSYFMQGYFEINETSDRLPTEQAALMKYEMDKNLTGFGPPLHKVYTILQTLIVNGSNDDTESAQEISNILENIFLHVIDPSYEFTDEKNQELQTIHDSYKE